MMARLLLVSSSLLVSLVFAEVTIRFMTVEKQPGYEYFMGKPWRYLLPFSPKYETRDTASTGRYRIYHSLIGWDIGPSAGDPPLYFSDTGGTRCTESEFMQGGVPASDTVDILCLGDSFTHGDAVAYEETWPYLLQQLTGRRVLNLGVGGYGIDQIALKYLYTRFWADTIIVGLISGDLERATTTIYNFFTGGDKTKPRFVFNVDDTFALVNQPCAANQTYITALHDYRSSPLFQHIYGFEDIVFHKTVWDNSYIWRLIKSSLHRARYERPPVYRTDDSTLAYCLNILAVIDSASRSRESHLIVLLLDNLNTFGDRVTADDPWVTIRGKLRSMSIDVVDPTTQQFQLYKARPESIIHPYEGLHYSPEGHMLVARALAEHVLKNRQGQ